MTHPRILKRSKIDDLWAIDAERQRLEEEMIARQDQLNAQHEAVLAEARERAVRDCLQSASRIVVDAENAAEQRLQELEPEVAKLVAETVARIIGEMDQDEAVRRATAQALLSLRSHRRAQITAAPDVVGPVREAVEATAGQGAEVLSVEVDERLEPGRTLLSSDRGHVEIGLPSQLSALFEVWQGVPDDEYIQ